MRRVFFVHEGHEGPQRGPEFFATNSHEFSQIMSYFCPRILHFDGALRPAQDKLSAGDTLSTSFTNYVMVKTILKRTSEMVCHCEAVFAEAISGYLRSVRFTNFAYNDHSEAIVVDADGADKENRVFRGNCFGFVFCS